jgi:hypothetical protein
MRKETGERNAPPGSLVPTGNLANAPLNGARSHSRPAKGCLAGVLPAIPAQAHVREASDQGGERQNSASPTAKVLRKSKFRRSNVWGAFCFDSRFPCGLASSVRLGAGSGGREAARAGFAWRASACGAPRRGVRSRFARQGQGLSGAFLSPLSLGMQRKRLGRVTHLRPALPNADSRTKQATNLNEYIAFRHTRSKPQTPIPAREQPLSRQPPRQTHRTSPAAADRSQRSAPDATARRPARDSRVVRPPRPGRPAHRPRAPGHGPMY